MSMVVSSIEVYKKESLGLLLGRVSNGSYIVTDVVPYQSAKRDYEYVSIGHRRKGRVDSILRFLSRSRLIGDFHSHPDREAVLSSHDRSELLELENDFVSIVLSVRKLKQMKRWRRNADESISGTIGRNFFVKLAAYRVNNKGRIVPVRIRCSYLRDINKKLVEYRKLKKKLDKIKKQKRRKDKIKKLTEKRLKKYLGEV